MIVQLHSVVLLNIADTLTRLLGNSSGLLLGYELSDRIVVATTVELSQEDAGYIEGRYNLFKEVYPCSIVGKYELNGKPIPQESLVLTLDESFQPQCYINGKLVKTVIDSSETEVIATATIANQKQPQKVNETLIEALKKVTTKVSSMSSDQVVMVANLLSHPVKPESHDLAKATADLAVLTSELLS